MQHASTTPFGVYLAERNIEINDLPVPLRNIARSLRHRRAPVAPNSPLLPRLAEHLNVPVDEITRFAKAEPMGEKWVRKIETQLERGTIPQGKKHSLALIRSRRQPHETKAAKPKDDRISTKFTKLARAQGFTISELANRLGLPHAYMWRVSSGIIAKNHPVIPILATTLKVDENEIRRLMKLAPMKQAWINRAQKELDKHTRARASGEKAPGRRTAVVKHAETNGHAPETRSYNRLKRLPLTLRNSTRAMVATLNVSVMRGDTHLPPIPVGDMYVLLQDYLEEKGIKANVLIDPTFPTLFDPKDG